MANPKKNTTKPKGAHTTQSTKKSSPVKKSGKGSKGRSPTTEVQLGVGQKAPAFSLLSDKGEKVSLSDCKGKRVVLYFYPKDDTPGCTKEACAFRDGIDEIQDQGALVLGVSADSVESHQKFSRKYDLNFSLLSDPSKKMLQTYGVWKEKSLYGRKFMGIERTTFIIDENGKIVEIFRKVKVESHLEEVLGELDLIRA